MPGWTRPSCPPALMRLTFQCGGDTCQAATTQTERRRGAPDPGGLGKSPWRGDSSGGPRAGGIKPTEEGKLKARNKICSKSTWGHVGSSKPTRASLPTDYNRLWTKCRKQLSENTESEHKQTDPGERAKPGGVSSTKTSCYFLSLVFFLFLLLLLILSNSFDWQAGPQWSCGGSFKIHKGEKTELKREIHKSTIIAGDLNTPLSITERTSRQKIGKDLEELTEQYHHLTWPNCRL